MSLPSDVASVPGGDPVGFAGLQGGVAGAYWPVVTSHSQALVVSFAANDGAIVGAPGRRFLADRSNGVRYHVGVDLFCREGDEVVALADGRIVNFYRFYTRPSTGEETYALFVAHDGVVVNYGEVRENSPQVFGWSVGDNVVAGQRLARVSGTAMIHFETYVPGTTVNARWTQQGPRPASLRNPSRLLVELTNGATRIHLDGTTETLGDGGAPAGIFSYDGPKPGSATWHAQFHGDEWRYDERGVYTRDKFGGEVQWRTAGEPVTCREIVRLYGGPILDMAEKHGVNPALIVMTIATETAFARPEKFTGARTFRWEALVDNTDVAPPFKGTYSAGPMQCLATSVRDMLVRLGDDFDMTHYAPFTVAPAINPRPVPPPNDHPLYDGPANIDIGTAEIRMRWNRTGDDPILVAAAFNTGGLYPDDASPWGLRAYGDHLHRAARWYGDACQVLSEHGVI